MSYTAEENPDICKLVLFVRSRADAVIGRSRLGAGWHRGQLRVQTVTHGGERRTTVRVCDVARRRMRWRTVISLDGLEIKDGARFRPAREVLAASPVISAEDLVREMDR